MHYKQVAPALLFSLIVVSVSASSQNTPKTHASRKHSAPASLLSQLQAARVTAVPQPLVIGGQVVCKAAGNSTNPKMIALDSRKNRTDIPSANAYISLDWNVLSGLPSKSPDDLQGAPVMVEGYLSHQIKVQTEPPGESTNCNLLNDDEVDWHMYLTNAPNQGIADAIIVETTPRTRPLHQWNKATLDNLVNKNTRVRISGWLMYDFEHAPEIGKERATVWEVHPITRMEVADGSGGWKDVEQSH